MGRCPKPKSVELSEGTISVAEIFQILCLKALQQVLYFLGAPPNCEISPESSVAATAVAAERKKEILCWNYVLNFEQNRV